MADSTPRAGQLAFGVILFHFGVVQVFGGGLQLKIQYNGKAEIRRATEVL